ncbi:dihydroorotase [bacterium]|nr:dihydroorotase [bacterium]
MDKLNNGNGFIIRGAEVFDGEKMLGPRDVEITGGQVSGIHPPRGDEYYATVVEEALGRQLEVSAAAGRQVIDGRGKLLCPGFIDLHCHLRDPGQTWKEDIFSGSAAAAAGGFTTVVCMPNTDPPVDDPTVADYIHERARRAGRCRVLAAGCLSRGRDGTQLADLAGLYAAGVRVFSDDGSDTDDPGVFLNALEFLSMLSGTRVLVHAEVPKLARGVMHEGRASALLGHDGIHRLSEEIAGARAILSALSAGQPLQITHISSAGTLSLVRYGKEQARHAGRDGLITADTTFNHLLLTDEAIAQYGTLAKINPPLRTEEDRQALLAALVDGTLDALVTDHAPHTADEKAQELQYAPFGIAGFEVAFGLINRHLVGRATPAGPVTLECVLKLMTSAPADLLKPLATAEVPSLGVEALADFHPRVLAHSPGRIAEGTVADLVLIDVDRDWQVDPDKFVGKGRNTPFAGWDARGVVELTFLSGEIVHHL